MYPATDCASPLLWHRKSGGNAPFSQTPALQNGITVFVDESLLARIIKKSASLASP